jgi:hypothetical protein
MFSGKILSSCPVGVFRTVQILQGEIMTEMGSVFATVQKVLTIPQAGENL